MSVATSDPLALDGEALGAWLSRQSPEFSGPISLKRFEGGQSNPTYLLACGERRFVLRKKPPGPLLPSAHLVEREYRVISALCGAGFQVPRPVLICEDGSVIGTAFYLMELVSGRQFWDPALPDCAPAERGALYDAMNATLARLHGVDWRAVGLADFGKPKNYLARQIARWRRQYEGARLAPFPDMDRLIAWLEANLPDEASDAPVAIVHGDFRIDNMIFDAREPKVLAVLDWELATLGHPLADLAYNCLPFRLPSRIAGRGVAGLDLASLGLPSEAAYVESYRRKAGCGPIANWPFFVAFAAFRVASILFGVRARARQGNAASSNAEEIGGLADVYAEIGWRAAQEG
jgi:aminoglycoside phosphotransferase (APT) family kinase protein